MKPIRVVRLINHSSPYMKTIFTQGGCYRFYEILKGLFPQAKPMINADKNHVVAEIDGLNYDINGIAHSEPYYLMDKDDIVMCKGWSFESDQFLSLGECPHCDEPLLIESKGE